MASVVRRSQSPTDRTQVVKKPQTIREALSSDTPHDERGSTSEAWPLAVARGSSDVNQDRPAGRPGSIPTDPIRAWLDRAPRLVGADARPSFFPALPQSGEA